MKKGKKTRSNIAKHVRKATTCGIIGVIIAFIAIILMQTYFSIQKQESNSSIKLNGAADRVESQATELADSWNRYDSFSQAKADVQAYFYDHNLDKIYDTTEMAEVWQLTDLFIVDENYN